MGIQLKYNQLLSISLAIVAFIQVVFPSIIALAILILFVVVIKGWISKAIKFKFYPLSFLFVLFYLAYAIGVFYTHNESLAWKYLEYKLSFLIFPLLLSFRLKEGKLELNKIMLGFTIGVVIIMIYGLINSIICHLSGGVSCFVTVKISPVHHPSYFDAFLIFSMTASVLGTIKKWQFYSWKWVIPLLVFGFIFHLYSLSLAALLFLIFVIGILILCYIYKKLGLKALIISLVLAPLAFYFCVTKVSFVRGEWNSAVWFAEKYLENPEEFLKSRTTGITGSEQRLIMWTVAVQEFKENPWGVGTANVDEVLGSRLLKTGQFYLAKKKLNPHNQYLQTGVELGIFGLLIFLLIIIYGIYYSLKTKNWLLLILIANLAFNCLFESMLQRQSGVVFYTFWLSLLVLNQTNKSLNEQPV